MSTDHPNQGLDEPTLLHPQADPRGMLADLPLFAGMSREVLDAAVAELEWISLPGGTELFSAGSPADSVYFVISGCLGAFAADGRLIGRVAAGESVGEMGLIAARPRTATVRALRDSDLARLAAEAFQKVLLQHPETALRLARLTVERLDDARSEDQGHALPRTLTLVPFNMDVDVAGVATELVEALSQLGRVEMVWSVRGGSHTSQWFHEIESRNDFVVYAAEVGDSPWTRLCVRQADALLLLARAESEPGPWAALEAQDSAAQRSELLLLHDAGFMRGAASRWHARLPGVTCHHVKGPSDVERVARLLTGRALGLVLSGGGARGFAHLGVIRALREHDLPIDLVGGTSMGGILGAGVAAGWSDDEMVERFRRSFVDTNPLSDFTLPLVSLVAGRKVGRLLRREFGEVDIEDLPLPFFCVSANLTSGQLAVHEHGPLWRWLRASLAIPGVLPPVFLGGEVFVDGGSMNNLPVDIMRARRRGPVVGVDVGTDKAFGTDLEATEAPTLWNLLSGKRRAKRPNILQILWRVGMVGSAMTTVEQRRQTDLLVTPPLESIDLLDWKAMPRAIELGYRHTCELLAGGALKNLRDQLKR